MMRRPEQLVVGTVSHPSFLVDGEADSPHLSAAGLRQPIFVGIGDADQVQSIELQQRFFDTVAPLDQVEVEIFPGADYGFSWPEAPTYDESAATRCFERTKALFGQHLRRSGR